ncbi:hypothetical protein LTA6_002136 [Microbacterium sp. LTA6]|uniref:hypothetical protein n=1 Tax=unclassified Microbacterium TaxID=2609290 RepID=UPI0031398532
MSRVGGRNLAVSWVAGILCAGVIGGLLWFAVPIVPSLVELAGGLLRDAFP